MTIVNHQYILYLNGADTIYQKLVALKKCLALINRARKLNIIYKYHDLLYALKIYDHEKWL